MAAKAEALDMKASFVLFSLLLYDVTNMLRHHVTESITVLSEGRKTLSNFESPFTASATNGRQTDKLASTCDSWQQL